MTLRIARCKDKDDSEVILLKLSWSLDIVKKVLRSVCSSCSTLVFWYWKNCKKFPLHGGELFLFVMDELSIRIETKCGLESTGTCVCTLNTETVVPQELQSSCLLQHNIVT